MRENHTRYAIVLLGETMKKRVSKLVAEQVSLNHFSRGSAPDRFPANFFGELDDKRFATGSWERYETQSRFSPINRMRSGVISQTRAAITSRNSKFRKKQKKAETNPAPVRIERKNGVTVKITMIGGLLGKLSKISEDPSPDMVDENFFR